MPSTRSVGSRWLRAALLVTCGFAAGFLAHRSSVYERVRAWLSPLVDEPAHPKTAAILSREQSPWKGLDEASRTSARDVDQLAKRLLARHREWTATRAKDGAEAVAGYREALKEMLRRGGNEFPESGKSDDWHFFDGRSFAEELTDGSFVDLQEAVIRKVSQWMQRERIQPVVVFVPNPLDIHAHDLMPAVPASADLLPLRTAMVSRLLESGLPVIDLRWRFTDSGTFGSGPFFNQQGHVWNARGSVIAAAEVAEWLRPLPELAWASAHSMPFEGRWTARGGRRHRTSDMLFAVASGGKVPADDCCSPLWVTGDCNLFVDGEEATGIAADFTSQVARLVRLPLHGMSRFGEGVSPLVEELQRDTAVRPRVVLWVVSSAGGRAAWEQIRVPSAIRAQAEGKGGAAPFGDLRGRQVRILQTPSLEKLAGSPYPDAVGAFEAEEVRTKVRLSLIFIVKRNGSVEPRLPQRGQEIQFDGCSWESQTEAGPETRRWLRMESSDDLSLSQVFVESWK